MTAQEHAKNLRAHYRTLATMDEFNLAYRIAHEAIGTSNPEALAAKLKSGAPMSANAPLDEQAWFLAYNGDAAPATDSKPAKADKKDKAANE